jgi:DNA-binding NtrC family response regulator
VLSESFRNLMLQYEWPGNVRELENLMRRLLVYQNEAMITGDLEVAITQSKLKSRPMLAPAPEILEAAQAVSMAAEMPSSISAMDHLAEVSRQAEARLLLEALEVTHWNRRQAAQRLNLDYKAFLYKLQKLGIVEKREKAELPQTV